MIKFSLKLLLLNRLEDFCSVSYSSLCMSSLGVPERGMSCLLSVCYSQMHVLPRQEEYLGLDMDILLWIIPELGIWDAQTRIWKANLISLKERDKERATEHHEHPVNFWLFYQIKDSWRCFTPLLFLLANFSWQTMNNKFAVVFLKSVEVLLWPNRYVSWADESYFPFL